MLLCAVPLFKLVRRALSSPSAQMAWFAVFVIFFMLSRIADEMTVISFVGFVGNLVGAILFKTADVICRREDK